MLRHGDIVFLEGFVVYVREVHVIELHATQLLQLLLDTATHFKCNLKDFLQILFLKNAVRIYKLYQAAYHLADCNSITLI